VVFQDSVLDGLLTVRENLLTRAALYIRDKKRIKAMVKVIADITGLTS
jgi:ABC-type multidrug transport system ATPase subunit